MWPWICPFTRCFQLEICSTLQLNKQTTILKMMMHNLIANLFYASSILLDIWLLFSCIHWYHKLLPGFYNPSNSMQVHTLIWQNFLWSISQMIMLNSIAALPGACNTLLEIWLMIARYTFTMVWLVGPWRLFARYVRWFINNQTPPDMYCICGTIMQNSLVGLFSFNHWSRTKSKCIHLSHDA